MSKKWYVELSQRNPQTDEMVRKRFELFNDTNINSLSTPEQRYALAKQIIAELNAKLAAGWTIFNDTTRFVYEDQTQYAHQARIYKKMVESNSNASYWLSRYIAEELRKVGLSGETLTKSA